jgi:hypothetical protein
LNDGQATPVAHTFTPTGPDKNGVLYFKDVSSGIPIGFPTVSVDLKAPSAASAGQQSFANRVYRANLKIAVPILESNTSASTVNGIPPTYVKAYDVVFRVEAILPERSSLASRKDALAYCANYLASTAGVALFRDLEGWY